MICLASRSPRRRELLKKAGIPFRVVRSDFRERHDSALSPAESAVKNAVGKCRGARAGQNATVVGADTLIAAGGQIIGKPRNRACARTILRRLSGKTHGVITGTAVENRRTGMLIYFYVESRVTFRRLKAAEIESYLDTGEYRDKAGAYGYQGEGRRLVRRIKGPVSNIVGLPVERLKRKLARIQS